MNFADSDPALRPLLDRYLSASNRSRIEPVIAELGTVAAGRLDLLAGVAEVNVPTLRSFSPSGDRIDEVDFHPAYDEMVHIGFCEFALAAVAHRGVLGWSEPAPHVVKYALSYVFSQAEYGLGCPLNMTDSAARVLTAFDPERFRSEIDALTSTDRHSLSTAGMFMTEVDGGTDLAQTATVATENGDHWTLRGRKWFCSNVTADVILTLARVPGQGDGVSALGMFMVPRRRPDGSRNGYRIDRLKNKLGSRSMASGEVTLLDAYAQPVGQLSRGLQQMLEMVNHSRVSNVMRSTALMRRGAYEAISHARQRRVFGKPLFDQPLMRRTLLGLQVDVEAALGLVLELGDQLDRSDAGDERARIIARILTPAAKFTICKRARWVTAEAMEVRGGNGYVEDWINARLVRDAHLGSIWEGATNVMALDVLRCMRTMRAHEIVAESYLERLNVLRHVDGIPMAQRLAERWRNLRKRGDDLLELGTWHAEAAMGDYTEDLSQAVMATLLIEQASWEAQQAFGPRKMLVTQTFLQGMFTPREPPAAGLAELPLIVEGIPSASG